MANKWPDGLGVWNIAEDRPNWPAIVASSSGASTYGELAALAHQIVHGLRARGLGDSATVAVLLPNDSDIVAWSLACHEAGWYVLPINYQLSVGEISTIINHSEANVLVASARYTQLIPSDEQMAGVALRISIGGEIEGYEPIAQVLAGQPTTPPEDRRQGSIFTYTSGTTGAPKGIRRTIIDGDPSDVAEAASLFGRAFGWEPFVGCHLVCAAMHHVGTHSFYMGALNVGQGLVIMPKFDAETCLQLIDRYRVTTSYMVPTMFHRLLQLPEQVRARYDVSSLRSVVHSAAPCPRELKQEMMDWWGPIIYETYGGSEGAATIAKPHRWLEKPGTVGRAVRGVQIEILDDDGVPVSTGQTGHVYIKTEAKPFSYHGNAALTAASYRGRRFTIGDLGYLDKDGYLFLQDRAKDMIITGGVNVYPAEVEHVLMTHPAVGDVAVIGIPHPEWGEEIKAFVVLRGAEGSPALERELIQFCESRLAHFKRPRTVEFREQLPRTDAGKLYKRLLRDEYWQGLNRVI